MMITWNHKLEDYKTLFFNPIYCLGALEYILRRGGENWNIKISMNWYKLTKLNAIAKREDFYVNEV